MRIRYLMIAAMALMLQIIPSVSLAVSAGDDPSSSDLSAWSSFRSCGYLSGASNRTTNVKAVQDITSVYSPTTRSYIMDNGGIDGSFGIHTKSAVFHIQRYYDLYTDGEVGPNTSVTITYTCVVMQCQRYISTQACAKFCICCCLNKKSFIVKSEPHTLQVCCCCQGNN